eukprot:5358631-Amphidinium_carterae.2
MTIVNEGFLTRLLVQPVFGTVEAASSCELAGWDVVETLSALVGQHCVLVINANSAQALGR